MLSAPDVDPNVFGFRNQDKLNRSIQPRNRLFMAVASSMMIQREGVDQKQGPARRRNSLAKLIRKQAFQHGIALSFEPQAKEIFLLNMASRQNFQPQFK